MKIYGRSVCFEAFYTKQKIFKAYILKDLETKDINFISKLKNENINIIFSSKKDLDKMYLNNQGYIFEIADYKYYNLEEEIDLNKRQCFLMLDGITDPQNLGAILRTAEATNIDGIIIPKNNSISINETVAKISTGSLFNVKVIMVNNLNTTIDYLKENRFWVYGSDINGTINYTEIDINQSIVLIIGSEGYGMRKLTKNKCDYLIKIPMNGKINSLNASFSAGLLMYEVFRKNNFGGN